MAHHRVGLTRALKRRGDTPQVEPSRIEGFLAELESFPRGGAPPPEITNLERAMLDYAMKLSRTPWAMANEDLEPLRAVGLSDRAVLELNQVVAYFAYANRVADGLGITLESET